MKGANTIITGSLLAMMAVGMGAIGSHALEGLLTEHARIDTYGTAVDYHLYHSLGMIIAGILYHLKPAPLIRLAGGSMAAGIVLFSGSLYLLSLSNQSFWAYFTPFGGIFFILSWLLLAIGFYKARDKN